jgi:tetratricopeptide (TPR) repeat protein
LPPSASLLRPLAALSLGAMLLSGCTGSMARLKNDSLAEGSKLGASPAAEGPVDHRAYAAYLKAIDAERAGELDEAARLLRQAMEYDPRAATVQARLGKVLAEKREIPQAIEAFRKALAIDPNHFIANLQLAELLQFNNQLDDAEAAYQKAIAAAPEREDGYLELANLYRAQGRPQQGVALIEKYKARGGDVSGRMLLLRAALYKDMNRSAEAEQDLLTLLDEDNEYRLQAQKALLDLYLAEGNLKEAAARLEKLHEAKPWLDWVEATLVQFYALLGDVDALNRRLAELSDANAEQGEELRLEAVEELASHRDFDKAMRVLEPMLRQSDNARAWFYAGFLYARRKDYDKALEMYGKIPESSELYTKAVEQRALALQAKGDTEKAVKLLQSYLKDEPDADEARMTLVSVYNQAKRPADALKVIEEILARNPGDVEALTQKAFVLHDTDRDEEAIKLLRDAIAQQKNQTRFYEALALILGDDNRYLEAVEVLKEALKVQPDNETLRFSLGNYYDKLKMHDEAISQMQKILELNENNADAMNFIGYTWADLGVKLQEAETLIKRALELDPNNGYITDSLGWLYYRMGKYGEAAKTLERAVELTSQEPIIVEHLADTYLKLEKKDRALELYRRAATEIKAQEKPDPEDVRRIVKKYEELKSQLGVKDKGEPARKGGP